MEITRNVIIDLLPLYIEEDASDDAPVPLTWEDKMEAYKEAKRLMLIRTIMLAGIISVSVLALLGLTAVVVMFLIR